MALELGSIRQEVNPPQIIDRIVLPFPIPLRPQKLIPNPSRVYKSSGVERFKKQLLDRYLAKLRQDEAEWHQGGCLCGGAHSLPY